MATLHRDLTGSELHEPKGVAGASLGTVYVANGSGSGTWELVDADSVSLSVPELSSTDLASGLVEVYQAPLLVNAVIPDISTASTVLIPIGVSGTVDTILFILGGTITSANAGLTITRSDGAAMGSASVTYSGSTEGTTVVFTPSGNNTITSPTHRYIKIVTDGASTGAVPLYISALVSRS